MLALAVSLSAVRPADPRAVAALERFLSDPSLAYQYSGSRRLEASGGGQQAWLEAKTDFTTATGLLYEVTAEGGSGYIRGRVLRSLLDEERRLTARGGVAATALSNANYDFTPEGIEAEGTALVGLRPLRKDRSLITGRMFLDLDGTLLKVEGLLAKTPSFWVSRVRVVRTYRRLNGAIMPVSVDTTAQLRLLGASSLRMTYHYSQIDDRTVDDTSR